MSDIHPPQDPNNSLTIAALPVVAFIVIIAKNLSDTSKLNHSMANNLP